MVWEEGGYNAHMGLPQFSLKQLFESMFLIAAGLGGIVLSFRADEINSPSAVTVRVVGGVLICIGASPLVTSRRPILVLIATACGAVIGGFLTGSSSLSLQGPKAAAGTWDAAVYGGVIAGALVSFVLAAVVPVGPAKTLEQEPTKPLQPGSGN